MSFSVFLLKTRSAGFGRIERSRALLFSSLPRPDIEETMECYRWRRFGVCLAVVSGCGDSGKNGGTDELPASIVGVFSLEVTSSVSLYCMNTTERRYTWLNDGCDNSFGGSGTLKPSSDGLAWTDEPFEIFRPLPGGGFERVYTATATPSVETYLPGARCLECDSPSPTSEPCDPALDVDRYPLFKLQDCGL